MASTPTDVAPKQRALVSGLAITVGVATLIVDVVPAGVPNKNKAAEFHSLCHKCEKPVRLRQQLGCPNGHGPFTQEDVIRKGQEDGDGKITEFAAEEIAAIRGADPEEDSEAPKEMVLDIVRTPGLMDATLPGDVVYRLRPNKKSSAKGSYDLLRAVVQQALKSGKVAVGRMAVRGTPKLYWLTIKRGQVLAQALMWPDDVAAFDEIPVTDLGENVKGMVAELVDKLAVDFDPTEYRNMVRARAEAARAAKESPDATITPITKPAKTEVDLESVLAGMLSASA